MSELKGFMFVTILVLVLKKIESDDKTKYGTFYSLSKAETIINESDFDDNVFKSINTTVISNIQKSLGKSSSWIIDSVIEHNINISKYKISKELDHPGKGFFSFYVGFLLFYEHSQFTRQQGNGQAISLIPLYHFHPLQRHLDINRATTAES